MAEGCAEVILELTGRFCEGLHVRTPLDELIQNTDTLLKVIEQNEPCALLPAHQTVCGVLAETEVAVVHECHKPQLRLRTLGKGERSQAHERERA